ncbi:MAG: hypothetical protein R3C49_09420 [Planctomycetaceae bacterium]
MQEKFQCSMDFDIDGPLRRLSALSAPDPNGRIIHMLQTDESGRLKVASIDEAKFVFDHLWDNAYRYAGTSTNADSNEPLPHEAGS